jgi:cell division protein FtsW
MGEKSRQGINKNNRRPIWPAKKNEPKKNEPKETAGMVVRYCAGVDRIFLALVIVMMLLGTIMIASASYANSLEYNNDSYYFIKKQFVMAAIGLAAMILMSYVADYIRLERVTVFFFAATVVANYLTAFFGTLKNGARRWFDIPIINVSVQPSEILKLAVVMVFAYCIENKAEKMKKAKWGVGVSLLIMAFAMFALILQKHVSGFIIIGVLCVAMLVIGDAPAWFLWIVAGGAAAAVAALVNFTGAIVDFFNNTPLSHVAKRLAVWKNPYIDPLKSGHQIIQSLYAIGSGGWTGLGLGQSKQKFLYLPEPQNDYIFAIVCEELGYVGAILIIIAFVMLIFRGVWIAYKAPNKFASCLVLGIIIKIALQVILNIAVVTNILPATGITMPFFSYGGTALIILMAEMGIILSISKYSIEKPQKE